MLCSANNLDAASTSAAGHDPQQPPPQTDLMPVAGLVAGPPLPQCTHPVRAGRLVPVQLDHWI